MLTRLVVAVVIGVVAFLVCILLGTVLVGLRVDVAVAVGSFLKEWASVIAFLVALYQFATGKFQF